MDRIVTYLDQLRKELNGLDKAIIQDALADAEEHLRAAGSDHAEAEMDQIFEQYGSPAEVAAAYREVESRTYPGLGLDRPQKKRSLLAKIFGVFADPKAWGGLIYMLISLFTGVMYFTWTVTGTALSVSLLILIIGIPLALLFLLSVRGVTLLEGRLVEALLGTRMPRRAMFTRQNGKLIERIRELVGDKRTWLGLLYLLSLLPIGTVYFTLMICLLALAFAGVATPIFQVGLGIPLVYSSQGAYFLPPVLLPVAVLIGILFFTLSLHVARGIGQLHGKYARVMLVPEPRR